MLPRPDELSRLDASLLRSFLELVLHPTALAVIGHGVDLGLFEALARPDPALPRVEAPATGVDAVALEIAVELGLGLDLLRRTSQGVALTPLSRTFLTRASPYRLLGLVEHYRGYLGAASTLPSALSSLPRAERTMWRPGAAREEFGRYFAARQAYNESRRAYYTDTAYLLLRAHRQRDLGRPSSACDVGAGPGAFACLLSKSLGGVQTYALEASYAFPEYRARSEAMLREELAAVELLAANALVDPWPEDIGLITFNRLLSGVPREGARAWIDRAYAALAPGGVLAAVDMFLSGDPSHDRWVTTVVAQWMAKVGHAMQDPPAGPDDDRRQWGWSRPWHVDELRELLHAGGFVDLFAAPADIPFTLVGGRKPG